jgi:hypothetical protein
LVLANSEMDKKTISNFGITDQSKCVFGEKKLLEENLKFENVSSIVSPVLTIRPDSCFLSNLPVINFNLGEKPVDDLTGTFNVRSSAPTFVPGLNMAVEELPDYLQNAKDNEESAWDLQGLIFHDDELDWCRITDWGVDHGTNIVFYSPVESTTPETDEEHASLSEVLTWIQQSPVHARISDYKSSRAIRKSNGCESHDDA